MTGKLALEDGTILTGTACGARGTSTGEVVFNTAMTGYQEVLTDPSYCGQIVTMTFPLQGNYGVNQEDVESNRPQLSGLIVKELPRRPSNFRATSGLRDFLVAHGIIGLCNVDTRAITRRIREHGAVRGAVSTEILDDLALLELARAAAPMTGANLVRAVTPRESGTWSDPLWHGPVQAGTGVRRDALLDDEAPDRRFASGAPSASGTRGAGGTPALPSRCHVVVMDCGIKRSILRYLVDAGARVTTVPADASAASIRAVAPDGLLVGNGPGDPAVLTETIETLRGLLGRFPIFGVCLGHQLLALALGAKTYKLRFGHHGINMPVLNQLLDRVEITSQNHGFAVEADSLVRAGGTVTHINLNDGSLEGFTHGQLRLFGVQFHPEASPGPHDSGYLFRRFVDLLQAGPPAALEGVERLRVAMRPARAPGAEPARASSRAEAPLRD